MNFLVHCSNRWFSFLLAALLVTIGAARCPAAEGERHPRLFLKPDKVTEIRDAIAKKGSHHAEAFDALKEYVDTKGRQPYDPASKNWNYDRAYMARAAALVHLITGEERYADLAFSVLKDVHDKPDPDRRLPDEVKTYGLAKATVGEGFALAYDWCYNTWSQDQREYVKDVLVRSLDVWPKYSHSQLQVERGSNWAAVCRGAELTMLLASYEDENRLDRLKYLINQLQRHLSIVYGPGGASQEGIGYTGYGGIFLLEACFALEEAGDDFLVRKLGSHAFWRLAMFAGSSVMSDESKQRRFIQQGVSGSTINDEGWASLAIRSAPSDKLPYYLWFYDRHAGKLAPGSPEEKYDNDRAAWVWALLCYPTNVEPQDPSGKIGCCHFDGKTGAYFFRNRWKDENDILVATFSDLADHRAWDQRETTGLRMIAFGTPLFGGPGKSRDAQFYSRVLVDGKADAGKNSGKNGKQILAQQQADGGYVIVGGGSTYRDLGLKDLTRHALVDFSLGNDKAIVSTLDRIESGGSHRYTWNANLGDERSEIGPKPTAGKEDGRPFFLLTGDNGWVKGWVLHPADATVKPGDPLQIETKGTDADIWVVMLVGSGTPPKGSITGDGLSSVLDLAKAKVRFDEGAQRIRVEK